MTKTGPKLVVTYARVPSGVIAIAPGLLLPNAMEPVIVLVDVSMIWIFPESGAEPIAVT